MAKGIVFCHRSNSSEIPSPLAVAEMEITAEQPAFGKVDMLPMPEGFVLPRDVKKKKKRGRPSRKRQPPSTLEELLSKPSALARLLASEPPEDHGGQPLPAAGSVRRSSVDDLDGFEQDIDVEGDGDSGKTSSASLRDIEDSASPPPPSLSKVADLLSPGQHATAVPAGASNNHHGLPPSSLPLLPSVPPRVMHPMAPLPTFCMSPYGMAGYPPGVLSPMSMDPSMPYVVASPGLYPHMPGIMPTLAPTGMLPLSSYAHDVPSYAQVTPAQTSPERS